ncbi:MAG: insulinase family protein, partial [Holosporales bacterium]|nr:insulinase family protein [Holosporales bacterium]
MQKIILSILFSLFITVVNANKEVENANSQLDIQERVIENDLRVIVVNMKTNGSVTFGVGYFVGAADDPRDVVGVSHFLEHMMFTGTKNIGETKLKEIIEQCNKNSNAFTGNDITFYY